MSTTTGAAIAIVSVYMTSRCAVALLGPVVVCITYTIRCVYASGVYSASDDGGLAFIDNGSLVGETGGKVEMWGDRPQTSARNRDG